MMISSYQLRLITEELYIRFPLLGGWIRRRAAQRLASLASPQAIAILAEASTRHPDRRVVDIARQAIEQANQPAAIDAVCRVWASSRDAWLTKHITQNSLVARRPIEVRLLTALKTGQADLVQRYKGEIILPLLQVCDDRDAQIARLALKTLNSLKNQAARNEVCRLVIEQDHPQARLAAIQSGYQPSDITQRGIFFFLTDQWQAYQELDFDQRLLRSVYQAAPAALRQRILEKIRQSGQVTILNALSVHEIAFETQEEAQSLASLLTSYQQWPRLWELVFEAHLPISLEILHTLASQTWLPEAEDERQMMSELVSLTSTNLEISGEVVRSQIPAAVECAKTNLLHGRINELAFSPTSAVIALGTSMRKVTLWDFQSGQQLGVLGPFDHSIGQVSYNQTGQLFFAERTNSDAPCKTYLARDNEVIPIWQQPGSTTALEPLAATQLLIAGSDHALTLLELTEPLKVLASHQLSYWPRAMRLAPDGSFVALLHYGFEILSIPDFKPIALNHQGSWRRSVARCAAFTPDGHFLLAGTYKGALLLLPIGAMQSQPRVLAQHPSRLLGVETLNDPRLAISLDASGTIQMTEWLSGKNVGKVQLAQERPTSLHVSVDGSFMALGTTDSTLSLWDLRPLTVPALFEAPLARSTPNQLAVVNLLLGREDLPGPTRGALTLLDRLLRHRFRYDIDISAVPTIKPGEYDIEIE
ncbi:MAG: WD40 repeat domain-containing protein [Anaerolineales bacterium]|nr:WD40 repeat domain-containing protein [Anaerolineales bacterium]